MSSTVNLDKANKETLVEALLPRLARQTVMPAKLASINGSEIYQISECWQREILLGEDNIAVTESTAEFENAVQNPDKQTIFVTKTAAISIARTIFEFRIPCPPFRG